MSPLPPTQRPARTYLDGSLALVGPPRDKKKAGSQKVMLYEPAQLRPVHVEDQATGAVDGDIRHETRTGGERPMLIRREREQEQLRDLLADASTGIEALPALQQAKAIATRLSVRRLRPVLPAGLTPREMDVLQLVAQGLTDSEVAERLFVSPRTVGSHLTSVYNKLGVNSRVAATRFAIEQGLSGTSSEELT